MHYKRQPHLNSTHNMESIAVNFKSEWWGSLLVKYWGEKACDKGQHNNYMRKSALNWTCIMSLFCSDCTNMHVSTQPLPHWWVLPLLAPVCYSAAFDKKKKFITLEQQRHDED